MAMVLQMSMMEERSRQEAAAKAVAEKSNGEEEKTETVAVPTPSTPGGVDLGMSEEELLQQALQLSMNDDDGMNVEETSTSTETTEIPTNSEVNLESSTGSTGE